MLNLSFGGIMVSLVVSSIGYAFFRYGRKRGRSLFVTIGVCIMVFPYFVFDTRLMIGITAGLCAILYLLSKQGF